MVAKSVEDAGLADSKRYSGAHLGKFRLSGLRQATQLTYQSITHIIGRSKVDGPIETGQFCMEQLFMTGYRVPTNRGDGFGCACACTGTRMRAWS